MNRATDDGDYGVSSFEHAVEDGLRGTEDRTARSIALTAGGATPPAADPEKRQGHFSVPALLPGSCLVVADQQQVGQFQEAAGRRQTSSPRW